MLHADMLHCPEQTIMNPGHPGIMAAPVSAFNLYKPPAAFNLTALFIVNISREFSCHHVATKRVLIMHFRFVEYAYFGFY